MEFNKILSDTHCKCLDDSFEDLDNTYIRKLKTNQLLIKDFQSYWEIGRRCDPTDCKEVCKRKAISINKYNENTKQKIIKHYKRTFNYNPSLIKYLCVFKFNKEAGKIKHSPSTGDKSHHSFYKCDTFSLEKINVVEIKPLE